MAMTEECAGMTDILWIPAFAGMTGKDAGMTDIVWIPAWGQSHSTSWSSVNWDSPLCNDDRR